MRSWFLVISLLIFADYFPTHAEDGFSKCIEAWTLYSAGEMDKGNAVARQFLSNSPDADPLSRALAHKIIANCEWSKGESNNQYVALNEIRKAVSLLRMIDAKEYNDVKMLRDIFAEGCVMAWEKSIWIDCELMGDSYLSVAKEFINQDKTTFLTILYITAVAKQNLHKHEAVLQLLDLAVIVSGEIKEESDGDLLIKLFLVEGDSMIALGQTDNAIMINNMALQVALPIHGLDDPLTLEIKYHLGESLYKNGRLEDALDMFRNYAETSFDVDNTKRFTAVAYCGEIFSTIGRPEDGAAIIVHAMKDKGKLQKLSKSDLSNLYLILSALQKEAGETEEAKETYNLYLSVAPISPEMYHVMVVNALESDNLDSAREKLDKLKAHYSAIRDTVSSSYADYLSLEFAYCHKCNVTINSNDITRFVTLRKNNFGEYSEKYANSLMEAASYHLLYGNRDEMSHFIHAYIDVISNTLATRFISMNKNERDKYWQKIKNSLTVVIPQMVAIYDIDSLHIDGFQAALLSKGLLLRAEKSLAVIKDESQDASIRQKIDRYQKELDLLSDPVKIDVDVDELTLKLVEISSEIVKASPLIEQLLSQLSVKVKDISLRLKKNDLAVEFVLIPGEKDSNGTLIAYLLRKDWVTPKVALLMKERDLLSCINEGYLGSVKLSKSIWGNIMKVAGDGVKNVYFAPDGPLYSTPIEYLPDYEDSDLFIFNRWNLFRLSSTGELALRRKGDSEIRATLYGGMDYDDLVRDKYLSSNNDSARNFRFDESFLDETGLRGGVSNLPETGAEVNNIARLMVNAKIDCNKFTGAEATEQNFKVISGTNIPYVHIATHGFYWTPKDYQRLKSLSFLEEAEEKNIEDFALMRSGLLFSGANKVLSGQPIPVGVDDGVLTALEITTLDLTNIDMIVLSACETGLGDITSDGVFGLQRGFKKAGVKSLLMSLWKVDDRATQILMTKFYEYLLTGKGKHESIMLAQKYVREFEEEIETSDESNLTASQRRKNQKQEEPGFATPEIIKIRPFEDPKYWAAFILLDALD